MEPEKKAKARGPRSSPPGAVVGPSGLRRLRQGPPKDEGYLLKLYVTGTTPASLRAIERVREEP